MKERIIYCRCEDITEEEVVDAIRAGATTLEELKRTIRTGTGTCQGRTCTPMIRSILARELKLKPQDIKDMTKRPPLKPVPADIFIQESQE